MRGSKCSTGRSCRRCEGGAVGKVTQWMERRRGWNRAQNSFHSIQLVVVRLSCKGTLRMKRLDINDLRKYYYVNCSSRYQVHSVRYQYKYRLRRLRPGAGGLRHSGRHLGGGPRWRRTPSRASSRRQRWLERPFRPIADRFNGDHEGSAPLPQPVLAQRGRVLDRRRHGPHLLPARGPTPSGAGRGQDCDLRSARRPGRGWAARSKAATLNARPKRRARLPASSPPPRGLPLSSLVLVD